MKRFLVLLSAAAVLMVVSCTSSDSKGAGTTGDAAASQKTSVQVPNPRVSYDKPDFSEKAGFAVKTYPNYKLDSVVLIADRIGELNFSIDVANKPQFRVAVDTGKGEDISGVYDKFEQNDVRKIGNTDVKVSVNAMSSARALWVKDGYTFSLYIGTVGDNRFLDILTSFVNGVVMEPAKAVKK